MKYTSRLLVLICLAVDSFLLGISPAFAQLCWDSQCIIRESLGTIRGYGTLPLAWRQPFEDLLSQGDYGGAENLLNQFLEQNPTEQVAFDQALGRLRQLQAGQFQRLEVVPQNQILSPMDLQVTPSFEQDLQLQQENLSQ